ncbi:DNA-binding protein [candidate division WWE3 bacterium CG10_big_fil_rev_8_21_14_0_10_39_14]|uniref:DNA-binding protein n=1 Tax=candidate division WWE3 bacterium CG23_combo_of_CG06-09_8_20_14_all_40_14 TaxID=1975095 RepID=A0A2G9XDL6_UNCKA|nr:MAG: DNA-binding protein [candidate division WWE3 bacterium CG23_combo_of_CG06-09_8_20_14_all_40_14]PJE50453.1 MAG: DNA-binding protein [candidate division WWE3 bacterium CG10_big_fil_rev_8_21_14_0_10_39_14]
MASNKIGVNIKKIRTEKGYSLEKIARLADLSLNTIVKVESGVNQNPTFETLQKIAKALDVSVEDIIQ